jgi:hypothetical protein
MVDPSKTSYWLYWSGALLAVVAIGMLALLDLICSRWYFRRLQQMGLAEQAALKAQLTRLQAHRGNGDHR